MLLVQRDRKMVATVVMRALDDVKLWDDRKT